jgi:hypothetical protein
MVLLAVVALGLMFVMPKLMENSMSLPLHPNRSLCLTLLPSGSRDARRI